MDLEQKLLEQIKTPLNAEQKRAWQKMKMAEMYFADAFAKKWTINETIEPLKIYLEPPRRTIITVESVEEFEQIAAPKMWAMMQNRVSFLNMLPPKKGVQSTSFPGIYTKNGIRRIDMIHDIELQEVDSIQVRITQAKSDLEATPAEFLKIFQKKISAKISTLEEQKKKSRKDRISKTSMDIETIQHGLNKMNELIELYGNQNLRLIRQSGLSYKIKLHHADSKKSTWTSIPHILIVHAKSGIEPEEFNKTQTRITKRGDPIAIIMDYCVYPTFSENQQELW